MAWAASPNKLFSVKSAHSMQAEWARLPCWNVWRDIWRLRLQERIKFFLWELSLSRLLTNEARWKWGFALSPHCTRCVGYTEDCLHLLRDCVESRLIWHSFLPPQFLSKFFSLPLKAWLEWNIVCKDITVLIANWPEKFAIICWQQWKMRNDSIFGNYSLPIHSRLSSIHHQFKELDLGCLGASTGNTGTPKRTRQIEIRWLPPPISFIKLNVDGASKGNPGRAAAGYVLRDHYGRWIVGGGGLVLLLLHCQSRRTMGGFPWSSIGLGEGV